MHKSMHVHGMIVKRSVNTHHGSSMFRNIGFFDLLSFQSPLLPASDSRSRSAPRPLRPTTATAPPRRSATQCLRAGPVHGEVGDGGDLRLAGGTPCPGKRPQTVCLKVQGLE